MPTQKEELQLNTQQDMSSEDMYVLKKLFTEYVSLYIPAGTEFRKI